MLFPSARRSFLITWLVLLVGTALLSGCSDDDPDCGDGQVNGDEACDDGNDNDLDDCRNDCTVQTCGNGTVDVDSGEACDDGNDNNLDSCRNDCTVQTCGNGVRDAGEECDGDDFGGEDCTSHGFISGSLACTTRCELFTDFC